MPRRAVLSAEQLAEFRERGVLVVPGVLSASEVAEVRGEFHALLKARYGVDALNLDAEGAANLALASSTNGAGGILDIFHEPFQLRLASHPTIVAVLCELWRETLDTWRDTGALAAAATWAAESNGKYAGQALAGVDRVCFRLPDHIAAAAGEKAKSAGGGGGGGGKKAGAGAGAARPLQRHLAPHLDCCPHPQPPAPSSAPAPAPASAKWRPVQCFVALTDCPGPDCGGLEAAAGHHRDFYDWAARRAPSGPGPGPGPGAGAGPGAGSGAGAVSASAAVGADTEPPQPQARARAQAQAQAKGEARPGKQARPPPCLGEFTPLRPAEDADVLAKMAPVPCSAGALVLWDNRIPHANARSNAGPGAREVVYLKLLPRCALNEAHVQAQRAGLLAREPPRDFWIGPAAAAAAAAAPAASDCSSDSAPASLGPLGRRLFGLEPWGPGETVWSSFLDPDPDPDPQST